MTEIKKKISGPKVARVFKTTLTLGTVNGNTTDGQKLERSMKWFLNPLLMKEEDSGTALTPLSDCAKDYALWRLAKVHIRIMPVINDSNVTGTILILSLDQDAQAAKQLNVDSVLARPNIEVALGQRRDWHIPMKTVLGPREGWWNVDTNEVATTSTGPGLDVHTYCPTFNLLNVVGGQMTHYPGPLFILQATVTYEFANYEPKPGLGTLVQMEAQLEKAEILTDEDNNIVLDVTEAGPGKWLTMVRHLETRKRSRRQLGAVEGAPGVGSTIWSIASDAVQAGSAALPGPWGWLLRGGFNILRNVLGGGSNGNAAGPTGRFLVYPSIEDAQRHNPAQNDVPIDVPVPVPLGNTVATQVNSLNVQNNTTGDIVEGEKEYPFPMNTRMAPLTDTPYFWTFPAYTNGDQVTVPNGQVWFDDGHPISRRVYFELSRPVGGSTWWSIVSPLRTSAPITSGQVTVRWLYRDGTRIGNGVFFGHESWASPTFSTSAMCLGTADALVTSAPPASTAASRWGVFAQCMPSGPGRSYVNQRLGQVPQFTGKHLWVATVAGTTPNGNQSDYWNRGVLVVEPDSRSCALVYGDYTEVQYGAATSLFFTSVVFNTKWFTAGAPPPGGETDPSLGAIPRTPSSRRMEEEESDGDDSYQIIEDGDPEQRMLTRIFSEFRLKSRRDREGDKGLPSWKLEKLKDLLDSDDEYGPPPRDVQLKFAKEHL